MLQGNEAEGNVSKAIDLSCRGWRAEIELCFSNVGRNHTFKCMCFIKVSSTGPVLRGVLELLLFAPS